MVDSYLKQYFSDTGESLIKKGADALGFGDERQMQISQEAANLTNQMVEQKVKQLGKTLALEEMKKYSI